MADPQRVRSIFLEAVEHHPPDQWSSFLDQSCGDDLELRKRVEVLLRAHEQANSMLDVAAAPPRVTIDQPAAETPGTTIGSYKLIEQIGEGGMGTVFMAQQAEPIKRVVAVKIIKPGMDSKAVLARFEAERQALALMDHPNIARVLDAGSTDSGRPFFVMELVKGVPITEYCDRQRLTPRERLELFVPVCEAIQHAHQKGVIHRDIKPSNVLVALYDDKPVPKVIDFGVAKATGQALTEKTLLTGFGALVGTPEYMSPEQANLNNLDIDTRSDVYSLGVLLYELLTGSTPLDRKSLGAAAILEVLRIVREVESPRPSVRLGSADTLPSIAANRSTEPLRLTKLFQGELDWVLLKALDKDRRRRYETANGLARDIERYLADEVVEARPPSTGYRLRKFVRRHKGQVVAAGLVLLALLAGMTGTTFGLIRAEQAKADADSKRSEAETQQRRAEAGERLAGERLIQVEAEKKRVEEEKTKAEEEKQVAQAVLDFLQKGLLGQANAWTQADAMLEAGRSSSEAKLNPTIRELLDRAALELAPDKIEANFPKQPLLQAELLHTVGDTYRLVGDCQRAIEFLTRAVELRKPRLGTDHAHTLATLWILAAAYRDAGKVPQAIELMEQVRDAQVKKLGAEHRHTLITLSDLAATYIIEDAGKLPQAIKLLEQVRDAQVKKLGADHPDTLHTLNNLAIAYQATGKLPEAIELFERVRDASVKKLGAEHPDTLSTLGNLANAYRDAGKLPQAIQLFEHVRDAQAKTLGADHPKTLSNLNSLAGAYRDDGKVPQAIELFERVRDARVKKLGADHPHTLTTLSNLAETYRKAGKLPQAIELFERVRDAQVKKLGADHPDTLITLNNLALAYQATGKLPQAIELLERVRDAQVKKLGADHPHTLTTLSNLAETYRKAGKLPQAIELFERVRDAQVKKLGADHPDTLTVLNNLALAYQATGKLPQAIELLERVRDAQVKKLGADHADTITTLNNLAIAYQDVRKLPQAIQLFEQVRDAEVKKLGADHPHTLTTLNNLAETYRKAGKLPQAIQLFEQVRDAEVKKLGADHPHTLTTLNNLAIAYQDVRKLPQALPLFEQAAAGIEKRNYSPENAGLIIRNTISAYEAAKQFDKAEAWRRKWLAVVKQKSGAESPDYVNELSRLGDDLLRRKKFADAEPVLRERLGIREKLLEQKHIEPSEVANAKSVLGEVLLKEQKLAEAQPLLVAAYEGLREDIPEDSRRDRVTKLIDLALAMNKPDDVKKWQSESMRLKTKRELLDAAMELARAGRLKEASQDFAKAIQLAPDDHWAWYYQGCLLAYQQDLEGYRKHCKAMSDRFLNSESLSIADRTAKTCLLLPEGGDAKQLLAAADRALAKAEAGRGLKSWVSLLKALALYRNGAFGDCIQFAQKSRDLGLRSGAAGATANLLSAMAYQRLGETKKARLTLDLALRQIDEALPPLSGIPTGDLENWLICQTLRREAERLIAGKEGLATARNKPDDAKKWQAELAKYPAEKPAETPDKPVPEKQDRPEARAATDKKPVKP